MDFFILTAHEEDEPHIQVCEVHPEKIITYLPVQPLSELPQPRLPEAC